ncbi:DUF5119 domain-containing protein [Bacteroides sp.]
MNIKILIGNFLFLLLSASCTQEKLKQREEIILPAHVCLGVDWKETDIADPPGTLFYFYPSEGTPFIRECTEEGFDGELASGDYHVLAVDANYQGVELTGMECYETATAVVVPIGTRTNGYQEISQPEMLYRFPFEAFTAEGGKKVSFLTTPVGQVRTVELIFVISNRDRLASLSGSLQGAYPSVLLSTGEPSPSALSAAASTFTPFSVMLTDDGGGCRVKLLGMLYPDYGRVYENLLRLTAVSTDGQVLTAKTDLSDELSRGMEANRLVLPLTLSIRVAVDVVFDPEPVIQAAATVQGWNNGGSTGSDVWN